MSKEDDSGGKSKGKGFHRRVTLRDIARELGVSHVTVSKALRNRSGASEELKARIRKKADEMGYVPDPMLSALSTYHKSSQAKPVQAALAWINTWSKPEELRQYREFDLYWEGAAASAQRFGYRLEAFKLAEIPIKRVQSILRTRNIQGILLPPLPVPVDWLNEFEWSRFAVVRFGAAVPEPKTHYVSAAQMVNTMLSFDRALQLGYQRIGFVCEYLRMRFFGAGFSWAQRTLPQKQQFPLLVLNRADDSAHQQRALEAWLLQTHPDAILTDNGETLRMLENLGYRIPEDIGLATTSIHDTPIDAGIDQNPFEIGRAAVRTLIALLNEGSTGIPETRNEILVEGRWVDGSMLPPRK